MVSARYAYALCSVHRSSRLPLKCKITALSVETGQAHGLVYQLPFDQHLLTGAVAAPPFERCTRHPLPPAQPLGMPRSYSALRRFHLLVACLLLFHTEQAPGWTFTLLQEVLDVKHLVRQLAVMLLQCRLHPSRTPASRARPPSTPARPAGSVRAHGVVGTGCRRWSPTQTGPAAGSS